jgi:hypothetical protein
MYERSDPESTNVVKTRPKQDTCTWGRGFISDLTGPSGGRGAFGPPAVSRRGVAVSRKYSVFPACGAKFSRRPFAVPGVPLLLASPTTLFAAIGGGDDGERDSMLSFIRAFEGL